MLTKNQDQWIDEFGALAAEAMLDTPLLAGMISKCGGGFTFVCYHAGYSPAMALGILMQATKGYEAWKAGTE